MTQGRVERYELPVRREGAEYHAELDLEVMGSMVSGDQIVVTFDPNVDDRATAVVYRAPRAASASAGGSFRITSLAADGDRVEYSRDLCSEGCSWWPCDHRPAPGMVSSNHETPAEHAARERAVTRNRMRVPTSGRDRRQAQRGLRP